MAFAIATATTPTIAANSANINEIKTLRILGIWLHPLYLISVWLQDRTQEAGCPSRSRGFRDLGVPPSISRLVYSQAEIPEDNSCPMAAARVGPGLKHHETRGLSRC